MITKTPDDLEAVRTIVDILQSFTLDDRERVIRWAREKLGMPVPSLEAAVPREKAPIGTPSPGQPATTVAPPSGGSDIRTFVSQKSPGSDTHFAATVAYYYQFMAPEAARKPSIGKDDLIDACRKVDRKRPAKPAQVLVNAYQVGLLDRADKGQYKLNSVGENLVAMVLPGGSEKKPVKVTKKNAARKKPAPKKPPRG